MVASPRNALSTSLEPPVTAGEGSTQQTFSVPCRKVTLAETIHFFARNFLFSPLSAYESFHFVQLPAVPFYLLERMPPDLCIVE